MCCKERMRRIAASCQIWIGVMLNSIIFHVGRIRAQISFSDSVSGARDSLSSISLTTSTSSSSARCSSIRSLGWRCNSIRSLVRSPAYSWVQNCSQTKTRNSKSELKKVVFDSDWMMELMLNFVLWTADDCIMTWDFSILDRRDRLLNRGRIFLPSKMIWIPYVRISADLLHCHYMWI